MTVYVDNMHETPMGQFGRMKMCHMVADTVEELHAMAKKIGVQRKWYQGPPKSANPHYDICISKRVQAVALGAKEITMKESIGILDAMKYKATDDYLESIGRPPVWKGVKYDLTSAAES